MVHTNYINKVNFIRRGIRCHGIPFKKCSLIYIFEAFVLGIYQNLEDISQKNSLISQILWLL